MNEILLYIAIGVGLVLVSLVVPGIKIIAELLVRGAFSVGGEILKHKGSFVIWGIKTLVSDHTRLIMHATKPRNEIDPTQKVRRKALGYDD